MQQASLQGISWAQCWVVTMQDIKRKTNRRHCFWSLDKVPHVHERRSFESCATVYLIRIVYFHIVQSRLFIFYTPPVLFQIFCTASEYCLKLPSEKLAQPFPSSPLKGMRFRSCRPKFPRKSFSQLLARVKHDSMKYLKYCRNG